MKLSNIEDLRTGCLLLSEPFMFDPNFKRSVVMLTEYNEEGVVGFILNKPMSLTIDEAMIDFPDFKSQLFYGGPVETQTMHFIHRLGKRLEGSQKITEQIYWGGDFDQLKEMIMKKEVSPHDIKFFVGYSGWGFEQLHDEFNTNSWIVANASPESVFSTDEEMLWKQILKKKGDVFASLANYPEQPWLN